MNAESARRRSRKTLLRRPAEHSKQNGLQEESAYLQCDLCDRVTIHRLRLTGLQAFSLALLGLLDDARRELRPDELDAPLDLFAARIANEYARRHLASDRRWAA
jgi:hypothetical protein